MDIKEQIHGLTEEMLTNLGRLVAIDSQLGTPAEGKPFGEGPAKALEEGLKIAQELGFKTVNLDNYCGYAEMGEGDEIVGIAGHLDIVPVGGDWSYAVSYTHLSFLIGLDRCFCSHKSDICLTGYYSRHCLICSKASYKRHIKPLIFKISFFDCHILRSIENRMCYFGEPHMTEVTCFQTL